MAQTAYEADSKRTPSNIRDTWIDAKIVTVVA